MLKKPLALFALMICCSTVRGQTNTNQAAAPAPPPKPVQMRGMTSWPGARAVLINVNATGIAGIPYSDMEYCSFYDLQKTRVGTANLVGGRAINEVVGRYGAAWWILVKQKSKELRDASTVN